MKTIFEDIKLILVTLLMIAGLLFFIPTLIALFILLMTLSIVVIFVGRGWTLLTSLVGNCLDILYVYCLTIVDKQKGADYCDQTLRDKQRTSKAVSEFRKGCKDDLMYVAQSFTGGKDE